MTPDPAVCARAALWGIRAVLDPAPDFNAALAQMMTEAGTTHGILVLAADLPYVQPADIVALIGRASPGVVALAPSKDGTGTNGFVVPPRIRFQPAFGSGSRSAHRREAHARGLEVVEVARPGLACDLDTPADLNALWGRGGESPA
jgi:2-phospho-L-lactate guanylyltransferase